MNIGICKECIGMRKSRILIVEDEILEAVELKNELEGMGHTVIDIVDSGERAIELAAELRPNVVLMDIKLQGEMNGFEAAEIIQQRFNIPTVYITAYAETEVSEQVKGKTSFMYLQKPFILNEIKATIDDILMNPDNN
jgi:CheY-like chemotaxis protein